MTTYDTADFSFLSTDVIKGDLHVSTAVVSNSNVIALTATLLVRLGAGYLCDHFGPRKTFALCLLAGAIPTFCAGGVTNAAGLYANRFFIGILGGSFVPCQVWMTGFFDKNCVGTANAIAAGLGNAGGGVTYFVMPAIYNALRKDGLTTHTAWRVDFIVPGVLIVFVALCLFFLCQDTPLGSWEDRFAVVDENLRKHDMVGMANIGANEGSGEGAIVGVPGRISGEKYDRTPAATSSQVSQASEDEKKNDLLPPVDPQYGDHEAHIGAEQMYEAAKGEVVRKPTGKEIVKVVFSLQTLVTAAHYFCSFGAELSINSILGNWYLANFKAEHFTLQTSGNWAAMFGLLNIVCRPAGGIAADYAYRYTGSVWAKKVLLHTYAIITGAFLIAIGLLNSHNEATMFGLVAGLSFFLEGGNGINYALVPHIHPHANGIVSGFTGAMGNFGGIIFAIIFRYLTPNYGKAVWIIGVITICVNVLVSWIPPMPKGQRAGR